MRGLTPETRTINRTYENMPASLPGYRPDGYTFTEGTATHSANWSFDSAGRPSSVTDGATPFNYGYLHGAVSGGVHTGVTTGGTESLLPFTIDGPRVDTVLAYDATRDVLVSRENIYTPVSAATTLSKFVYSVNAVGQREGVTTTGAAFGTTPSDSNRTWTYDALGQVVSSDSTGTSNDRAYSYDSIGNRKMFRKFSTSVPETADSNTTSYTANGANQYSALKVGTGANFSPAPSYDADGNMTQGPVTGAAGLSPGVPAPTGATNLLWDAENRLVGATVGNSTLSYTYDHLSRLVKRAVTVGDTTTTAYYLYDGWNRIAEWNGTSLSKVYLWGLDLSGTTQGAGGVGGLLSILDVGSSVRYYPTYDGNGNVSEYINSNGSGAAMLAAHFEYDPFGNLTAGTAANAEAFPYRFSTKPQDPVTGMLYYGYRFYDPLTGRWPSRDPMGENWNTLEFNEYAFIRNLSIHYYDVLGLFGDGGYVDGKEIVGHRPVRDINTGRIRQEPIWKKVKSRFKGHKDFDNLPECGFDYAKEDHQATTNPLVDPGVHFQDMKRSEDQVRESIKTCDPKAFQSAMHRLQDYFSHYKKGYRWDPLNAPADIPGGGWGHLNEMGDDAWVPPGKRPPNYKGSPDNDDSAWEEANEKTKEWLAEWTKKCCIKCLTKCEWVPKSVGPCASKNNSK